MLGHATRTNLLLYSSDGELKFISNVLNKLILKSLISGSSTRYCH